MTEFSEIRQGLAAKANSPCDQTSTAEWLKAPFCASAAVSTSHASTANPSYVNPVLDCRVELRLSFGYRFGVCGSETCHQIRHVALVTVVAGAERVGEVPCIVRQVERRRRF